MKTRKEKDLELLEELGLKVGDVIKIIDTGDLFTVREYNNHISISMKNPCFGCVGVYSTLQLFEDTWEKVSEPILTDKEKEYLSNVIKPFKDRVINIKKYFVTANYNYEYITIKFKELDDDEERFDLLLFNVGSMYKGMKIDREYTLEELNL